MNISVPEILFIFNFPGKGASRDTVQGSGSELRETAAPENIVKSRDLSFTRSRRSPPRKEA